MISKKIKMVMLDQDVTVEQIAKDLDVSRQAVYNSLHRDNFTSKKLEQIAAALNCDVVLQDRKTGKIY